MAIPRDIGFGLDGFQKPKILTTAESVAQYILNILLWRPGNLPGLPHIGLNMKELLYTFDDDFRPELLKEKIYSQCSELMPQIISSDIYVGRVSQDEREYIVIQIPIMLEDGSHDVSYAFYKGTDNQLNYGYGIDQL